MQKGFFHSARKTGSVRSAAQEEASKKWQEAGAKSHKKGVSGFQAYKDAALHKAVSHAKGPAIVGQPAKTHHVYDYAKGRHYGPMTQEHAEKKGASLDQRRMRDGWTGGPPKRGKFTSGTVHVTTKTPEQLRKATGWKRWGSF